MQQADLLRGLFQDARDLLVVLNPSRTVNTVNPAFRALVARAQEDVDFLDLIPAKVHARVSSELVRAAAGEEVTVDVLHLDAEGQQHTVEYRFFPLDGGLVAGIGRPRAGQAEDGEALRRARAELRSQTRMLDEIQLELTQVPFIDPVTGVWNRMQVFERLTSEWSRCERFASPLTLLLVDVPGLDAVTAEQGRAVTDAILKTVARRVKSTVRDHDIVGRSTGNQFVVVATHSDFEGAMILARRIQDSVTLDPISVERTTWPVTLHIGGATSRSEGVEILEDLFRVAEDALQEARVTDDQMKVAAEVTL